MQLSCVKEKSAQVIIGTLVDLWKAWIHTLWENSRASVWGLKTLQWGQARLWLRFFDFVVAFETTLNWVRLWLCRMTDFRVPKDNAVMLASANRCCIQGRECLKSMTWNHQTRTSIRKRTRCVDWYICLFLEDCWEYQMLEKTPTFVHSMMLVTGEREWWCVELGKAPWQSKLVNIQGRDRKDRRIRIGCASAILYVRMTHYLSHVFTNQAVLWGIQLFLVEG